MFDVRCLEELKKCTEYLNDKEGKCDILINNAGIIRDKTLGR
jgi:NADP-dependent 3-hydroxy acid dehydrogenase YdfG